MSKMNMPTPEQLAAEVLPCNCKPFGDGSHWYDCVLEYQKDVADVIKKDRETLYKKLLDLNIELNCRIDHGANSNGHLEYVQTKMNKILAEMA